MALTLGIALFRRRALLVGVQRSGNRHSVVFEHRTDRAAGSRIDENLKSLLSDPTLPPAVELRIALSPADLACGDGWHLPRPLTPSAAAKLSPALCEMRCASETLETLAVDSLVRGLASQAVALDRVLAEDLVRAAGRLKVTLLTAIPAALAEVFKNVSFTQAGERIEVKTEEGNSSWRSYPVDRPDETGSLPWNGLAVPFDQAAAFAAAVSDPERVPNVLQSLPTHRKSTLQRFRDPLLSLGIATTLCFGALGIHFHRDMTREQVEYDAARRTELQLWARFLPSEEPREGRLLQAMQSRLEGLGEASGGPDFPSALSFWGEIGRQMPDPENLGLTLESLDLAPDGGRISGRVPAVKDDPLKHAFRLE